MIINKIKKITIVSGAGVRSHEVGSEGVTEIKDNRKEYENHTDFIYNVMIGDILKCEIINCPVDVDYDTSEDL